MVAQKELVDLLRESSVGPQRRGILLADKGVVGKGGVQDADEEGLGGEVGDGDGRGIRLGQLRHGAEHRLGEARGAHDGVPRCLELSAQLALGARHGQSKRYPFDLIFYAVKRGETYCRAIRCAHTGRAKVRLIFVGHHRGRLFVSIIHPVDHIGKELMLSCRRIHRHKPIDASVTNPSSSHMPPPLPPNSPIPPEPSP